MALRHRRLTKQLSKFLTPVLNAGNCCQQSSKALNLVALSIMHMPSAQSPIANWTQVRGFREYRISTKSDELCEPATEIDLLSFIKASLDEFEVIVHLHLILGASIPIIILIIEAKLTAATTAPVLLIRPIIIPLATNWLVPRFYWPINIGCDLSSSEPVWHGGGGGACGGWSAERKQIDKYCIPRGVHPPQAPPPPPCCLTFRHEMRQMNLKLDAFWEYTQRDQAVQELQEQPGGDSKSLNVVRCTSLKQDGIIKDECSFSPLQNLLLYYPGFPSFWHLNLVSQELEEGCVSTDESNNRLFFSDCNHHRILVSGGNGEILDCIGSSPGFEDGDFESAKLRRPAGSYYHATEDCLYFVDSENNAIRKADMGARTVETLYPTSAPNKGGIQIWNWIMSKLGLESSGKTSVQERSEVFDSKLYFPWHLLKSPDDTFYIMDRRFQTLWVMDINSGKIDEVFEGSPRILKICGQLIMKSLSIIDQIPSDWFQQQTKNGFLLGGLQHSDLLSSLATLHNHIFICDPVHVKMYDIGVMYRELQYSTALSVKANGLSGTPIDHLQHFDLLPGRIDINLRVDLPMDIELVVPLQESCIWYQARGAATETSGMDEVSLNKSGLAQQWYDELDDLAAPKPESEINVQDDNLDKKSVVEDEKVPFSVGVFTSPGTSEVIIYAALYCKLRSVPKSNEGNREEHAARILDILSSKRSGKIERDLWKAFLLQSKGDLRDLIFMKPLHIRLRLSCQDHPKADNGRDFILTDSSIKVDVLLN
ncbi:hypothetical protein JHK84_053285 [Glycine max]|nr:hypothetical protein JHK84_053285 [Glycine max]